MKIVSRFFVCAAFIFLAAHLIGETGPTGVWGSELHFAQQASGQSAEERSRGEALLDTALAGVAHGLSITETSGQFAEPPPEANLDAAAAQAAYSVLAALYPDRLASLDALLASSLAAILDTPAAIEAGREWGRLIAGAVLGGQLLAPSPTKALSSDQSASERSSSLERSESIGAGRYRFSILAGAPGQKGSQDGSGGGARLDNPAGLAVDASGNVYFSEANLCTIRKITPDGVVTTLAGGPGLQGSTDGNGAAARFNEPHGLAIDAAGNLYVADRKNCTIRKISPGGDVTTLAGKAGIAGNANGSTAEARFNTPDLIALDAAGNVYISERGTGSPIGIRKIAPDGRVTRLPVKLTFTELHGASVTGDNVYFSSLIIDPAGNLYTVLTDGWELAAVIKFELTADGQYEGHELPIAANLESGYYADGLGIDGAGNIYINYLGNPIVLYAPNGKTEARYVAGITVATWTQAFTVGSTGDVYVVGSDLSFSFDATIRKASYDPAAVGPAIFGGAWAEGDSYVGRSLRFHALAAGTPTVTYQWYFNSAPISGATGATFATGPLKLTDSGDYSVTVADRGGSISLSPIPILIKESPDSSGNQSGGSSSGGSSGGAGGSTGGAGTAGSSPGGGGAPSPAFSLASALLLIAAEFRRRRGSGPARDATLGNRAPGSGS